MIFLQQEPEHPSTRVLEILVNMTEEEILEFTYLKACLGLSPPRRLWIAAFVPGSYQHCPSA